MKAVIVLIALAILFTSTLYSQNKEPENMRFYNPATSSTFVYDITLPQFQQTDFQLGWQWGGPERITNVLKMNANKYNCLIPNGIVCRSKHI